jgi:hypothetical protein
VRAATISVERGFVSGAEGFNVSEGSNGVTIDKGEVTLYLAACVTGARMEGTAW